MVGMARHQFGPMDHPSLVRAAEESSANAVTRTLGHGFASARTAVNVRTTALREISRGLSLLLLVLLRRHVRILQRDLRLLVSLRTNRAAWLSDPGTVEQGREQRLERMLRSTPRPGQGENLHPRLGMVLALSLVVRIARLPLYVIIVGFDAPYFFSYFLRVFEAPEDPALVEFLTVPSVMAAGLLALAPTIGMAVIIELIAPSIAGLIHRRSRAHVAEHALGGVILGSVLFVGLSVVLYLIAQSRFSASPFASNPGGTFVSELLVTGLPTLVLVAAVLAHNPRQEEALRRRTFARLLTRKEAVALKHQRRLVGRMDVASAKILTLLHRVQARLDAIGAVADQQVTWTALDTGVYGQPAPGWASQRTLGTEPNGSVVPPVLGVPTTNVARVERYVAPQLAAVLNAYAAVRQEMLGVRDMTGLFDAFRADPGQFLLVPELAPADPQVESDDAEAEELDIAPETVREHIDSLGAPLFARQLGAPQTPVTPSVAPATPVPYLQDRAGVQMTDLAAVRAPLNGVGQP